MTRLSSAGVSLAMLDSLRSNDEKRLWRQIADLSEAIDARDNAERRVLACARLLAETRQRINDTTRDMRDLVEREAA